MQKTSKRIDSSVPAQHEQEHRRCVPQQSTHDHNPEQLLSLDELIAFLQDYAASFQPTFDPWPTTN